jgi:hypothetical protein
VFLVFTKYLNFLLYDFCRYRQEIELRALLDYFFADTGMGQCKALLNYLEIDFAKDTF